VRLSQKVFLNFHFESLVTSFVLRFLQEYPDIKERATEVIGRQRAYAAQVITGIAFEEKINAFLAKMYEDGRLPKKYTLQTFPPEYKFNADETRADLLKGGNERLASNRPKVRHSHNFEFVVIVFFL
jgi:hypothetical protein